MFVCSVFMSLLHNTDIHTQKCMNFHKFYSAQICRLSLEWNCVGAGDWQDFFCYIVDNLDYC